MDLVVSTVMMGCNALHIYDKKRCIAVDLFYSYSPYIHGIKHCIGIDLFYSDERLKYCVFTPVIKRCMAVVVFQK